jgi:hypothetical protein
MQWQTVMTALTPQRIAIALYGEYSDWYQCNEWIPSNPSNPPTRPVQVDYYAFVYEPDERLNSFRHVHVLTPEEYGLTRYTHAMNEQKQWVTYMTGSLARIITHIEDEQEWTYDVQYYGSFRTVLLEPLRDRGVYGPQRFAFTPIPPMGTTLASVEIVSNRYVRMDGGPLESVYTMDPSKRASVWKALFQDRVMELQTWTPPTESVDIAVIIPSVIEPSTLPLSYTSRRSVFSSLERLNQTIHQLQSIDQFTQSSTYTIQTFIMEGSPIDLHAMKQLSQSATVILCVTDPSASHYANTHLNKSVYETYVMHAALVSSLRASWIFKFGGRYRWLPGFNISFYLRKHPSIKFISSDRSFNGRPIVECVLYSLPETYREQWIQQYQQWIQQLSQSEQSIEEIMYESLELAIPLDHLSIVGRDAIEGLDCIR